MLREKWEKEREGGREEAHFMCVKKIGRITVDRELTFLRSIRIVKV